MDEIHKIIESHQQTSINTKDEVEGHSISDIPTYSLVPDLFFDTILVEYKLTRIETLILLYLYRKVWNDDNIYLEYGISPLMSHTELVKRLSVNMEETYQTLRKLEEYGFIVTIRSGQYFVRRFFTKEFDDFFGQFYDELTE